MSTSMLVEKGALGASLGSLKHGHASVRSGSLSTEDDGEILCLGRHGMTLHTC